MCRSASTLAVTSFCITISSLTGEGETWPVRTGVVLAVVLANPNEAKCRQSAAHAHMAHQLALTHIASSADNHSVLHA